jgi:hypothetical protein
MGKPVAGEVVVPPFPQADLQPAKRRLPLVVVNLTGDDLILCQVILLHCQRLPRTLLTW